MCMCVQSVYVIVCVCVCVCVQSVYVIMCVYACVCAYVCVASPRCSIRCIFICLLNFTACMRYLM
jgi:hypothetical protein